MYRFIVQGVINQPVEPNLDMSSLLTSSIKSIQSMSINDTHSVHSIYSNAPSNFSSGKMPVSALQEFLQKRGEPIPVYTETIGGPPFTVTVRCGDVTVDHVGASKKDAKHKAAEAMLVKLTKGSGIPISRSSGNHDSNLVRIRHFNQAF